MSAHLDRIDAEWMAVRLDLAGQGQLRLDRWEQRALAYVVAGKYATATGERFASVWDRVQDSDEPDAGIDWTEVHRMVELLGDRRDGAT